MYRVKEQLGGGRINGLPPRVGDLGLMNPRTLTALFPVVNEDEAVQQLEVESRVTLPAGGRPLEARAARTRDVDTPSVNRVRNEEVRTFSRS